MASATVVTLPQMVDLALNSPEVGIVNFTVLHSLLHVIVKQLDLVDTNVEFRGSDSERLQSYIANAKPGPLLTLTEYTVGEEGSEKDDKKKLKKGIHGSIVEKGKTDEQQTEKAGPEPSESQNRVIVVESTKDIAGGPTVVVTKHHFDKLEDNVNKLGRKVKELAELPANSALIEVLRGDSPDTTPVLEMFQILNLSKRLDAAEVGMQKLASLMEDLAKKGPISPEDMEEFNEKAKELRSSFDDTAPTSTANTLAIEKRLDKLEKIVFNGSVPKKKSKEGEPEADLRELEPAPAVEKSSPTNKPSASEKSSPTQKPSPTQKSSPTEKPSPTEKHSPSDKPIVSEKPSPETKPDKKTTPKASKSKPHSVSSQDGDGDEHLAFPADVNIATITQDLSDLKNTVYVVVDDIDGIKKLLTSNAEAENLPPELRLNQLENKLIDCQEQLTSLDHMFCRQVEILQKRIMDLEKDAGEIAEKVNLGLSNADTSQPDGQTVGDLYNKLLQLQEELAMLAETAQKLLEDREEKQHTLDVMLEQIELLKTVKADREDLEDALADKADACMVNRKVSVEQFDAACGDMTKAIEDSLGKLSQQEELWAQALEEIQKEIGNKLDKLELIPLRDYINKKLKGLQDKFKSLTALKKENEAAGTKSKIMRNVNCISCDKDVSMRKEVDSSLFPKAYALPPTRNMAPYLAYELDQLRKQQKHIPPKKDLNMFENALKAAKSPKSPDHLCNRYCGGSHTVTTPQQRVTRLGHFLEQWGPEIAPANDTMIRGSDGHMYKGRDDKTMFPIESSPSAPLPPLPEEMTSTPKATRTSTFTSAQAKSEAEPPSQVVKKSSIRTPKIETETKPVPISATPSETPPTVTVEEPEPPKRKSRTSQDKRQSISKGARKRSKGSVKYSARSSGEIKVTEIPDSTLIEEPVSDAETEKYADPEA